MKNSAVAMLIDFANIPPGSITARRIRQIFSRAKIMLPPHLDPDLMVNVRRDLGRSPIQNFSVEYWNIEKRVLDCSQPGVFDFLLSCPERSPHYLAANFLNPWIEQISDRLTNWHFEEIDGTPRLMPELRMWDPDHPKPVLADMIKFYGIIRTILEGRWDLFKKVARCENKHCQQTKNTAHLKEYDIRRFFIRERSDKRFCCDTCRVQFHQMK